MTTPRRHEAGNILLIVMITMILGMLLASSIVNHFSVTEAREVENSLAKIRAYWAFSGMTDYVLSRARNEGLPGDDINNGAAEITKVTKLNDYFNERGGSGIYRVTYSDIADTYTMDVKGVATIDPTINPNNNNGHILLTLTLNATGVVPALVTLKNQVQPLNIDICLRPESGEGTQGDTVTSTCPTGVSGRGWINSFYRYSSGS